MTRDAVGRYVSDIVFGSNDGLVTTFAIVAGAAGANLSPFVVLALGFANLIGDGISMGLGEYLGRKSENEYFRGKRIERNEDAVSPGHRGIVMFAAFVVAGIIPLVAYFVGRPAAFAAATIASGIAMFAIGALRASVLPIRWWRAGLEMFAIGALAAASSFTVGRLVSSFLT